MESTFNEMDSIFQRTRNALTEFMGIITPIINNSTDDHERLYWHHIYEEEDHRSDRLNLLLPKLEQVMNKEITITENHGDFLHLLQDISLEKFGLHNFLEHLDLSLFQFKGTEFEEQIQALRDFTYDDYQKMKVILDTLNQEFKGGIQFNTSIPTDEKSGIGESLKIAAYTHDHDHDHDHDHHVPIGQKPNQTYKKGLTVGSLKQ
ncbi:IMEF encapsulin system ferritin-like cargo protein [Bacillus sp. T3]|uniref:IMEF encapsulin system ferritin-like cargo protein n=1 Tax=Bacillus sp. T3 TaxID=467262 RepID=UPI002980AAFA|nr:IMEF encapsulin system ferritin-like cargo protein [Bacillus sp. T3]